MPSSDIKQFYIKGFIFLAVVAGIGFILKRADFYTFYVSLLLGFGIYYKLVVNKSYSFTNLFLLGLIARVTLIFSTPELSDDFYRFLWDGELLNNGHNPFTSLPSVAVNKELLSSPFRKIFTLLNSKDYYTVYPTIIQIINFTSVFIGKTVIGSTIAMKILFLAFELITFQLLKKILIIYKKPIGNIFWYWLCPLVILEFVGNLHHECLMITFLLAAIYYIKSQRNQLAAIFLALAIFTKLTPLLFVPFFIFSISIKQNIKFISTLIISSIILSLPIYYDQGYMDLLKSIQLYFSSFEFNSSLYQLAIFGEKEYWSGYKWIYKGSIILIMGAWLLYWNIKKVDLTVGISIVYLIYVLSAQSVHPWYIIPLLPLSLMSSIPKSYMAWLVLIPLTYITYINQEYEQRIWVTFLEYGLSTIVFFLYDRQKKELS